MCHPILLGLADSIHGRRATNAFSADCRVLPTWAFRLSADLDLAAVQQFVRCVMIAGLCAGS